MGFDEVRALLRYWQTIPPAHETLHILNARVGAFLGIKPVSSPKPAKDAVEFAKALGVDLDGKHG